ncbi:hypothetical protein Tco_1120471 [Tanacetum coccineum]
MKQSPLVELRATSNSTDLPMMWTVAMQREIETDFVIARKMMGVVLVIQTSLNRRRAIIDEAKEMKNNTMVKSVVFFKELQDQELAVQRDLMLKIEETHMRPIKKRELLDYIKRL